MTLRRYRIDLQALGDGLEVFLCGLLLPAFIRLSHCEQPLLLLLGCYKVNVGVLWEEQISLVISVTTSDRHCTGKLCTEQTSPME